VTRLILIAIDVGASVVFMALCAKAGFAHFYKDVKWHLRKTDAALPLQRQRDLTKVI
jgi:hypothetical protein